MNDSKLVNLLRQLSKEEWKRLGKFLNSPYHNSNKKLIQLYDLFSKYYPAFSGPHLVKEKIFSKLFPAKKNVDQKQLANLMSQFLKQVNAFFAIQELEKKPYLKERLLCERHEKQNHYDLYEKQTKILLGDIEKIPSKSLEDYYTVFWIHRQFYFNSGTPKITTDAPHLQRAIECLNELFVLENLRLACEVKSRELMLSDNTEIPLLNEIKDIAQSINIPETKVHLQFMDFLERPNRENFEITISIFLEKKKS